VVTDKSGRHVGDLGCEAFEILEDGVRRLVSQCAYVPIETTGTTAVSTDRSSSPIRKNAPRALERDDVRRTMAFVVDDVGLDAVSVRNALTTLPTTRWGRATSCRSSERAAARCSSVTTSGLFGPRPSACDSITGPTSTRFP
jgi:hypothetical protein